MRIKKNKRLRGVLRYVFVSQMNTINAIITADVAKAFPGASAGAVWCVPLFGMCRCLVCAAVWHDNRMAAPRLIMVYWVSVMLVVGVVLPHGFLKIIMPNNVDKWQIVIEALVRRYSLEKQIYRHATRCTGPFALTYPTVANGPVRINACRYSSIPGAPSAQSSHGL